MRKAKHREAVVAILLITLLSVCKAVADTKTSPTPSTSAVQIDANQL